MPREDEHARLLEHMLDDRPVETTLYSLKDAAPEPAQRRNSERHLSLLRVGALIIEDRRELCLIRNISAGGMMIRAYSRIDPNTRLAVELKQGAPVEGVAKWARDDTVGVEFDKPIDVISLISTSEDGPRPRMPRVELSCMASLREDGTVHRVQAIDISQGGLKVVTSKVLAIGAHVIVTLAGLAPIPGVVRWQHDGAYGIKFNRALGLPVLVAWLQEQQQASAKVRRVG